MTQNPPNNRTFVLVHGAWHGGWCWQQVADLLRHEGHIVTSPTLTGFGERCHLLSVGITLDVLIQDIINHIIYTGLDNVTLVGHSIAGGIISGVADRLPHRLARLIYLDAVWLRDGQTAFDLLAKDIVASRIEASRRHDGGLSLPVPEPEAFGVSEEPARSLLKERMTPHPIGAHNTPLHLANPVTNGIPSVYIACTRPVYEPLALSRKRVAADSVKIIELTSGHDCMITHPRETSRLLMTA